MAKRIAFTTTELKTIMNMISIAQAGDMDSGDYEPWTDEERNCVDSLSDKVAELLSRREK
jgi:hypothetical protein